MLRTGPEVRRDSRRE
ncbi:hypothetical protein Taro_021661 [Colocasia esculenta]|uniref:Uncharacterized protein n=1 Tax=Colocasia esculenta TaxID=4460 RepID=A0A843V1V1_COLES|nr:hypothetical protein [Colocasia esculenta]